MNYRFYLLLIIVLSVVSKINAQQSYYPFQVSLGYAAVDIRTPTDFGGILKDYVNGKPEDVNMTVFPSSFSLLYNFDNAWAVKSMLTYSKIKKGFNYKLGDTYLDDRFFAINLKGVYFLSALPFSPDLRRFDPYLTAGGGYSIVGDYNEFKIISGYGLNYWINETFGIQFESSYNHTFQATGTDFFQHNLGLVIRFGSYNTGSASCPRGGF